jgi:hypothetical protein
MEIKVHSRANQEHARGMAASRLLLVMSLFLVLAFVGHRMIKRSMTRQTETRSTTSTGQPIDALPFKTQLLAVEDILYADHEPTYRDSEALDNALRKLSAQLEPSRERFMKTKALRFLFLAENIGSEGETGYGPLSPSARRHWIREWETIIKEEFLPVDWLKGMVSRSVMDTASTTTALENLLDELERIVRGGEAVMDHFGSTAVNLQNIETSGAQERLDAWRDWVRDWLDQVGNAAGKLPDGFSIPDDRKAAYEYAEFVLRRMKEVPSPGPGVFMGAGDEKLHAVYLPDAYTRETWFKDIHRVMEQARLYMEKWKKKYPAVSYQHGNV